MHLICGIPSAAVSSKIGRAQLEVFQLNCSPYNDLQEASTLLWIRQVIKSRSFLAEKIKTGMDEAFGASWHVIVGEDFTFNVDFEDKCLYYLFYGAYGIVTWKVITISNFSRENF